MRIIASLALFTLFLVALAGSESDEEKAKKDDKVASTAATMNVTAKTLLKDYEANELAFEEKYVGKVLAVTGTIDDVGRAVGSLSVGFKAESDDTLNQVTAYFSESHKGALAKLKKDQTVKVKCRCDGVSLGVIIGLRVLKQESETRNSRRPWKPPGKDIYGRAFP